MDHIVPYSTPPTFLPPSATWYKGETQSGMLFLGFKKGFTWFSKEVVILLMTGRAEGRPLETLNDVFYEITSSLGFTNSSVFYQLNLTLHPLFMLVPGPTYFCPVFPFSG
jgi:hypothetical protein